MEHRLWKVYFSKRTPNKPGHAPMPEASDNLIVRAPSALAAVKKATVLARRFYPGKGYVVRRVQLDSVLDG